MCQYGKVNPLIVYSFLVVENQYFNPIARSSKDAIGLMQIRYATANDIIVLANKKSILSDLDIYLLKKELGDSIVEKLLNAPHCGYTLPIQENHLTNPNLNIIIGCLFLRMLSNENNQNIAEMGIRYLHGYFAFDSGKSINHEILQNSQYVSKLQSIYKQIKMEV